MAELPSESDGVLVPLEPPADAAASAAPREVSVQVPKSVLLLPLIAAGFYIFLVARTELAASANPRAEPTAQLAPRVAPGAQRPVPLEDGQRAPRPGLPPLVIEELSEPERRPLGGTEQQPATSAATSTDVSSTRALAKSQREAEARELATMRERVDINVYYTSWCPACRSLRGYLAERGIRATEYDIESNPAARLRQRQLNPRGSIPTVDIEGQVLVGFNPKSIEAAIDRAARARLQRL